MSAPAVSVIVPAYNAMPYLTKCVSSVLAQSIGAGNLELIVVDDGSQDGTGEELDRLAAACPDVLRVVHQEASGGPAGPRNTGLDMAKGQYVFFLDADDYLGTEALERLVTAAEQNGSDVVLGKMTGVAGRKIAQSMFRQNQADADLFESRIYWTLSALKLFRRDLIERHRLRFPVDLPNGSDQPFTAAAYLKARRISVVADYECYFAVRRDDGKHVTRSGGAVPRIAYLERMFDLVSKEVPAGPNRDALLHRHFQIDVPYLLRHLSREKDRATQEAVLARITQLLHTHYSEAIDSRLPPLLRLRYHLAGRGLLDELLNVVRFELKKKSCAVTAEGDKVFAHYPYFRDPALDIPDSCYDVTSSISLAQQLKSFSLSGTHLLLSGTASLAPAAVTDSTRVEIVVRERDTEAPEYPTTAEHMGGDTYSADLDLLTAADGKPLEDGLWDLFVRVTEGGLSRTARLGNRRTAEVSTNPVSHLSDNGRSGVRGTTAYFTRPHSNLSLDLGEQKHDIQDSLHIGSAHWDGPVLRLEGRVDLPELSSGALALRVRESSGAVKRWPVHFSGGRFTAAVPAHCLPRGEWEVGLQMSTTATRRNIPVPRLDGLGGTRWVTFISPPAYAKPVRGKQSLTLRIDSVHLRHAARNALARLRP